MQTVGGKQWIVDEIVVCEKLWMFYNVKSRDSRWDCLVDKTSVFVDA